jgi:pullulanase/glycogen debranching enzyme
VFRLRSFLTGQQPRPGASDDVVRLWTDGTPMTPDQWNCGSLSFAMWLNGAALTDTDADALGDDRFLMLFNASWTPHVYTLPSSSLRTTWMLVLERLAQLTVTRPDEKIAREKAKYIRDTTARMG